LKTNSPKAQPDKLNIALWGLGRHALKNILPAIRNCREVALVGVYSRNPTVRNSTVEEYGCAAFLSEEAMLCDPRVGAVYLATPIGLHFEQGMRVLQNKRHLLCEKSLTDDYQKSDQLIAVARRYQLVLCETFMYRFHPRFAALSNIVKSRSFGKIVSVSSSFYIPTLENPGFRLSSDLGGGAFLDVACYPISLIRAIGDPVSVLSARRSIAQGSKVDTTGNAVLALRDGGHSFSEWGYGAAYKNDVTVLGENQSVFVEHIFSKDGSRCSTLILRDGNGLEHRVEVESADGFVHMLAFVAQATRSPEMRENLSKEAADQARLMDEIRKQMQRE